MYRAILLAQKFKVKIKVLLSPNIGESNGGSVIYDFPGNLKAMESEESLRGLVIKAGLVGIKINNISNFPGEAARITAAMGKNNILESGQGLITSGELASMSFLYTKKDARKAFERFLATLVDEKIAKTTGCETHNDLALFSLFDPDMQDAPGYLEKFFSILGELGINIEMYTTGPATINVVIQDQSDNVKAAAQALAEKFDLIEK